MCVNNHDAGVHAGGDDKRYYRRGEHLRPYKLGKTSSIYARIAGHPSDVKLMIKLGTELSDVFFVAGSTRQLKTLLERHNRLLSFIC
jgi:hypothetical protein